VLFAWGRYFFLQQLLCTVLPGIKLSRVPFRIIACYIAFMGLLAAYGYQELEKAGQEGKKDKGLVLAGSVFALLAFLIALVNPGGAWRELLALLLGGLGILLWHMTDSWRQLGRYCFMTALVAPLLLTGWSDFSRGPLSNYDVDRNFPVLTAVKNSLSDGRLFLNASALFYPVQQDGKTYQSYFPENAVENLGIRSITGYNPLQLQDVMNLRSEVGKNMVNFFRMTAVNGLLMGQDAGEVRGFTHTNLGGYHFYQARTPSVTAPSHWQWVPDPKQRLGLMQDQAFDPLDQVVLTDVLAPEIQAQLSGGKAQLSYARVKDEPNTQTFQVKLDKNSLVTFSEVNFPGWNAFVDGKPVKLFTANHVFRALYVPSGEHTVEFRFEPSWAMPLLGGAILWLLSALAFLFLSRPKAETHA
jgi:hypothetical protein